MIVATGKSSSCRDGNLLVLSQDRKHAVESTAFGGPPTLLQALESFAECSDSLRSIAQKLERAGSGTEGKAQSLSAFQLESPLPRTFLFADGSAFIHHIKLVRQARKAPLPETLMTVPLMYQAESGRFLAPTEGIPQIDFAHGTDFEAEIGVITDFVPMGTDSEVALQHIRFVVLINDVSLRGLIPAELAQGFGFFQSKPAKALSPFALTPDELGSAWQGGRLHLPLQISLNGRLFGWPHGGEMHFHFGQLIAHAARTRDLQPGTLIGSGTVSNEDSSVGSGCLAEIRTLETIQKGEPSTPFLRVGDRVKIWMEDQQGRDLFGAIDQTVISAGKK